MTHLSSEAVLKKVNDLTQPLAFFQQHYIIIFRGLTLTYIPIIALLGAMQK